VDLIVAANRGRPVWAFVVSRSRVLNPLACSFLKSRNLLYSSNLSGIDGGFVASLHVFEVLKVAPLGALVIWMSFRHVSQSCLKSTYGESAALSTRRCCGSGKMSILWSLLDDEWSSHMSDRVR
jgi:hypothetical protein